MREKKEKRTKIVAVFAAVVLIVALILGMVSCSSGNTTDPTSGTGEQLEHYPVGIVTKPTGDGNKESEPTVGGETEVPETGEPTVSTGNGNGGEATEPNETTDPAETGKPSNPVKPTEPKPTQPKPTEPKPTNPKPSDPVRPTEPKPTVPTPTEPKPTQPKPTEPKPTTPKPTEPKPTEPKPTEPIGEHTHSYEWVVTKEPNCKEDGYRTGKCIICGYCTSEHTPRLGHEYRDVVVEPTCTEKGYTLWVCDRCGEDSGNVFNFTQPLGHSYSVTAHKDKSCTTDGYDKYTCSRCGNSYTDTIPAAHNWVHHHEDAVGHGEAGIQCHCGYVVWSSTAEAAGYNMYVYYQFFHVNTFETSKGHSYYEISRWVVDVEEKNWDECSVCGKRG